jgi:rhodanese-related sulfurtransferase
MNIEKTKKYTGKFHNEMLKAILIMLFTLPLAYIYNLLNPNGIHPALLPVNIFKPSPKTKLISVEFAFPEILSNELIPVDVRSKEEFDIDHLPSAISLSYQNFIRSPEIALQLDRNMPYVLYCFDPDCFEAKTIFQFLQSNGYENVAILQEGMSGWLEFGFPVEP